MSRITEPLLRNDIFEFFTLPPEQPGAWISARSSRATPPVDVRMIDFAFFLVQPEAQPEKGGPAEENNRQGMAPMTSARHPQGNKTGS